MGMSDLVAKAMAAVDAYAREQRVGSSLAGYDPNGEPEGFVTHPGELDARAGTLLLVKDMMALLDTHYPGFRWAIQPGEFAGVFNVFCLDFSARWGYRIKMADIVNDPRRKAAVVAGQDILRRFGYPGNVFRPERMAAIRRNRKGEAIPDVSDLKKSRHTEAARLDKALAEGRATVVGKRDGFDVVEVRGDV